MIEECIPSANLKEAEYVEIIVKAYKRELSKEGWTALKGTMRPTAFLRLVTRAIGVANIYASDVTELYKEPKAPPSKPDPWGAFVKGSIKINASALDEVKRRSNQIGVVIHPKHPDDNLVSKLDRDRTFQFANEQSRTMGELSLGVVPFS